MIIESVRVQNFRCIKDETLPCDQLTVLVGPNGSGKSSFLRALEIFYSTGASYAVEDCYARKAEEPITVTVRYTDLTSEEQEIYGRYVENGKLAVGKEMRCPPTRANQKYYGLTLQNPEFASVRGGTSAADRRAAYAEVKQMPKYQGLPAWRSWEQVEEALRDWEERNPQHCSRQREETQFFGYTQVGAARLERWTRFLLIPAVLEASEMGTEGKGSAISQLLDLVVRSVLAQREDVKQFADDTQKRYKEIMEAVTEGELQGLAKQLTDTLRTYAPDTSLELPWDTTRTVEIPPPRADTRLLEDGYPSSVERAGHGVQRAFLLTLLQHLAVAQGSTPGGEVGEQVQPPAEQGASESVAGGETALLAPNLILGIEEPELYQHPDRQRHLSRILLQLATGGIEGVAESTQVIYATHSPLFVGIDRTDRIRVFRKVGGEGGEPKQTRLAWTSLKDVTREIEEADGKPEGTYSAKALESRLVAVMTPWINEGFFAKVAVLVEGEDDRAAVLGVAEAMDHDFEGRGISVIPCNGKTNLDRPAAIFRKLGIQVYVVWDGDKHKGPTDGKPEVNRRLLRLLGEEPEDWPAGVRDTHACFRDELGKTIRSEIGDTMFDELLVQWRDEFGYDQNERALKSPRVVRNIVEGAREQGKTTPTLASIVDKIVALL